MIRDTTYANWQGLLSLVFLDGYCSTVQGLLGWFEVDLIIRDMTCANWQGLLSLGLGITGGSLPTYLVSSFPPHVSVSPVMSRLEWVMVHTWGATGCSLANKSRLTFPAKCKPHAHFSWGHVRHRISHVRHRISHDTHRISLACIEWGVRHAKGILGIKCASFYVWQDPRKNERGSYVSRERWYEIWSCYTHRA